MAQEKTTMTPTWGYHRTQEPQIFHLRDGEGLPAGWRDAPYPAEARQEASDKLADKKPASKKSDSDGHAR
jgi:hypothetical protein